MMVDKGHFLTKIKILYRNKQAMLGLGIITIFILLAAFAPIISPYDPQIIHKTESGLPKSTHPPSVEHPFGTNTYGIDIFSQWIYGTQVSLMVGLASGFVVGLIGSTVGIISGYYKGMTDMILMRLVDILYGIPALPLILVLALLFGNSVEIIILAMALILWRTTARVIRSQTLSLSERPFIKSARATGASDFRIMFYHLAPNLLPIIFIESTIVVAAAIILEASVSFLGLGAELSWGTMLQLTIETGAIRHAWWWVLPPGLSITILVLAFFLVSRGIEDIVNPEGNRGFR
jgi:peptide/nickel transport system permease protein